MVKIDRLLPGAARSFPHLVLFLIVAAAYWTGVLGFLDQELTDVRFHILTREASQDVLLVEIDAPSLQELSVWPWPRSYHAEVIERLRAAGAERIVFDVDFSSYSRPSEDAALERTLAMSEGSVVLPVFRQRARGSEGGTRQVLSGPIPEFQKHVALASANLIPDRDGLIRQMAHREQWGEASMPTLFTALARVTAPDAIPFYIDYGIRPESFPRISYSDILLGRFDRRQVAGKMVLVGATALELGDTLSVPVYRALPGPVIQLLAHESVAQGRALGRVPRVAVLFAAFVILVVIGPWLAEMAWRRCLVILGGLGVAILLLSMGLQAVAPILLDVAPLLLAILFSFLAVLVCRTNRQDFRLMSQGLVIRRRDAFLRKILDNSLDGILVLDQGQMLRDCNQAAETLLDIRGHWAIGESLQQVAGKISDPDVGPQLEKALRLRGGPHLLRIGSAQTGTRFIQATISDTLVDGERKVIVLLRDVTAEKRAKILANKARLHLEDALESIHEGFALYDSADRLVLSNRKFQRLLFGDAAISLLGMTFEEVMLSAARNGRITAAHGNTEAWLQGRVAAHRRQDGQYEEELEGGIYLQVSERRTSDHGAVAIYHDVTALKERELALQEAVERESFANRSKTEFLANMSHELRTPLNAIIGFSELIAGEMLGPIGNATYKVYSDDILNSGRHLLELINEILDVSKIDAGKYELEETGIDVPEIIGACIRMLKVRIKDAELTLKADVPEDLPALHGSPRALKQVILNLLSNAIKFTHAKGSLFIEALLEEDGRFVIRVVDTGIGIAQDDIADAFALFGQVDSRLARKYEGTGLGLPLAQRLMELHGGELRLESEVEVGTAVTLIFPESRVLSRAGPALAAENA